jgi:septum site-determining protein MinC
MAEVLEFKSSQLSLTLVCIYHVDMDKIATILKEKLIKAGRFLKGAPVVVDPYCPINSTQLAQLLELLRQHQMTPVGIRTSDASLIEYAELCGLAVFKPSNSTKKREEGSSNVKTVAVQLPQETMQSTEQPSFVTAKHLINMRSGQLEKCMYGDVLVNAGVNSGAELYAGGNIMVLGSVRGRVHAGAMGNRQARIIAKNFNPELVSIAGVFLLSDDVPKSAKRGWVEVYLEQQTLKFRSLD